MKGGSVCTLVRSPDNQEGDCESLKGPITLAIDVLFIFFSFLGYFQIFIFLNNYVRFTSTSEFWLFIITHTYIVTREAIISLYNTPHRWRNG